MEDGCFLVTGEILPVAVHGSAVKMYPQKFPRIVGAALMKIRLAAIEKDMVARMQGKMCVPDTDGAAAGQYNKEEIGLQMRTTADMPVAAF